MLFIIQYMKWYKQFCFLIFMQSIIRFFSRILESSKQQKFVKRITASSKLNKVSRTKLRCHSVFNIMTHCDEFVSAINFSLTSDSSYLWWMYISILRFCNASGWHLGIIIPMHVADIANFAKQQAERISQSVLYISLKPFFLVLHCREAK